MISCRYAAVKNIPEMQKNLLKAIAIFSREKEGQSLARALADFQAAQIARKQREYPKAEKKYRAAIEVMREVLGMANPYTFAATADLAGMFRETGRMVEFEQIGQDLMDISQRVFPNGHPMLLEAIDFRVPFIVTQGRFKESISLIEMKIAIDNRFNGPSLLRDISNQGAIFDILIDQGLLEEANQLIQKMQLSCDRLHLSEKDVNLDWLRGILAGARGNLAEQERLWRDYIRQSKEPLGGISYKKVQLAYVIYSQRPKDPEIDNLLSIPNDNLEKYITPTDPHSTDAYLLHTRLLIDRGKLAEAESILKPISIFLHEKSMRGNYRIGVADGLMGELLSAKGDNKAAEPLLIAGFENLRKSRGDHHRLTREAQARVVNFYRKAGNVEQATKFEHILQPVSQQPMK